MRTNAQWHPSIHHNNISSSFTVLKILCTLPVHPFPSVAPGDRWSVFCLHECVCVCVCVCECVCVCVCVCTCSVALSCLTLWDPMDYSLPSSSFHGIFQARIVERVAISYTRGSSNPGSEPMPFVSPALAVGILSHWATWETHTVFTFSEISCALNHTICHLFTFKFPLYFSWLDSSFIF